MSTRQQRASGMSRGMMLKKVECEPDGRVISFLSRTEAKRKDEG